MGSELMGLKTELLTDVQVLEALREAYSPDELTLTLERTLRVPEAWDQLHDPDFLKLVIQRKVVTPAEMASIVLGSPDPLSTPLLQPELSQSSLEDLVQITDIHSNSSPNFETIAMLALELARRLQVEDESETQEAVLLALRSPKPWASILACAWPYLKSPEHLLAQLIGEDQTEGLSIATQITLANMSPDESVELLHAALPDPSSQFLTMLREMGENKYADALARWRADSPYVEESENEKGLENMLALSARQLATGDLEAAREGLDHAWQIASQMTARIADQVADVARIEGDQVLEVEARLQALNSHATPTRRASYALALLDIDKSEDAIDVLQPNSSSSEEKIAAGLAFSKLGETKRSVNALIEATQKVQDPLGISDGWRRRLAQGLFEVGERQRALQVTRSRVEHRPTNPQARRDLAKLLDQAGDNASSADQASLALGLEPRSKPARQILAQSLQKSGFPEIALPHWQTLSEEDPDVYTRMAVCALEANKFNLAEEAAVKMLETNPDSIEGSILMGKALVAKGNFETARDYLEKSVRREPQNPEAWIALSECQAAAGDDQAAGDTLSSAIQATPNMGSLHFIRARWLNRHRRFNEAMESAKKAVELDPNQVPWLLEYGNTLRTLGYNDSALPVLRDALSLHPENCEARSSLAQAYEERGEPMSAARLLTSLPPSSTPEIQLLTGRIQVKSSEQGDTSFLEKGLSNLEKAKLGGIDDPSLEYWLGRAKELSGQNEEAFHRYQDCLQRASEEDHDLYRQSAIGSARTAISTDQVPLAISTLETARQRFPASSDLLVQLAKAYQAARLPEQSLQIAHQAIELEPEATEPLKMLSQAAAEIGDWEEAVKTAKRLVELQPDDSGAWLDLARLSQEADILSTFRSALAHSLLLGRRDPSLLLQVAKTLLDQRDAPAAQRILKYAIRLDPSDPQTLQELAILSEQAGDLETAQQAWLRCTELQPDNQYAMSHGAEVLWDLGRRSAAIGLWQRAIALDEENAEIHIRLARAYLANGEVQPGLNHCKSAMDIRPSDADLTSEVGAAFLKYDAPNNALETLQKAVHLAPEQVEPRVNLSECLLKLQRPEEVLHALDQVITGASPTQRAYSLQSLAALDTGDLPSATSALASAVALTPKNPADAIGVSRAALRLGDWKRAIEPLEAILISEDNAEVLDELVRHRLRLMDAFWLYANTAEAHNRAPDASFSGLEGFQEVQRLIDRGSQAGIPKHRLDNLRLWSSVASTGFENDIPENLLENSRENLPGEIVQAIAIAYLKTNNAAKASEVLRSSADSLNPDAWGAILLGLSYAAQNNHPRAIESYQIAGRNPVVRPIADLLRARANWAENNITDAVTNYNDANAAWPEEATWHFELALLYLEDSKTDAAIPHLQQAVELAPGIGKYLHTLARALRATGQLSSAEATYHRVIKALPTSGAAWKEAGQLALANGNAKTAEAWFERACTLSPSDPHCLIGAAQTAMLLGKQRRALELAQVAARLAPDDLDVLVGMGEIFAEQGKYEKALHAYDLAIQRANDKLYVQLARSKLLIKIGRAKQAASNIRSLLEKQPDEYCAWAALSEALEASEDLDAALDAAEHAVRLSPRDPTYRLLLGRICRKSGQLDRSLDELLQAQSATPTDPRIPFELGQVYEERRDLEKALDAYQRALHLDPDNEQVHYKTGLIYKHIKAYQQAGRMFERVVELDPRDSDALHQLAAVRALELVHGGI